MTLLATQADFRDYALAFDPQGRYLYFLSLRTYDLVYDSVQFDLSFPRAARSYLIALQANGPAPFEPAPKGFKDEGTGGHKATAPAALPAIEPEGLARRVAAFPVPEGRFGKIAGVAQGKVIWTAMPIVGAHGREGHKDTPGKLEVWDFERAEVKTLLQEADRFVLADDHRSLLVRHGKQLIALDATRKPEDGHNDSEDLGKPSRRNGIVDLARVRLAVLPPQEWAQLLRDVWRLQRDQFWTADMSGTDWPAM